MDSSQQHKLMESFFQFQIHFRIIGRKQKNIQTNIVNIDQSAIYHISINSSRQALQINGKLFFQISESFFELTTLF